MDNQPYTKAERIQELDRIDESIVNLLRSAGQAIQTFDKKGSAMGGDEDSAAFKTHMDQFLRTLRSVDVRMKRQIWGLEEAEIVSLDADSGAKGKVDGHGRVGGLDAGYLNTRTSKNEKNMEAELWDQLHKEFSESNQN